MIPRVPAAVSAPQHILSPSFLGDDRSCGDEVVLGLYEIASSPADDDDHDDGCDAGQQGADPGIDQSEIAQSVVVWHDLLLGAFQPGLVEGTSLNNIVGL